MLFKTRSKNRSHRATAKKRYRKNPAVDIFDMGKILEFRTMSVSVKLTQESADNLRNLFHCDHDYRIHEARWDEERVIRTYRCCKCGKYRVEEE